YHDIPSGVGGQLAGQVLSCCSDRGVDMREEPYGTDGQPGPSHGVDARGEASVEKAAEVSSLLPAPGRALGPPRPAPLTVRDLLDIPRQVLPPQTYTHLKNAGREAFLAFVSLMESINE